MWYLMILTGFIGFAIVCVSLFQRQPMQKYLSLGALPMFFLSNHFFNLARLEPQTSQQTLPLSITLLTCNFGLLALCLFLDARHGKQMQKRVVLVYSKVAQRLWQQRK